MTAKIVETKTQLNYATIIAFVVIGGMVLYWLSLDAFTKRSVSTLELTTTFAAIFVGTLLGSFLVFRSWAIVRYNQHEGWRRILVILGIVGTAAGAYITYEMNSHGFGRADAEDIFEAAIGGLIGFAAVITVSTGAVWLRGWITEGFKKES